MHSVPTHITELRRDSGVLENTKTFQFGSRLKSYRGLRVSRSGQFQRKAAGKESNEDRLNVLSSG